MHANDFALSEPKEVLNLRRNLAAALSRARFLIWARRLQKGTAFQKRYLVLLAPGSAGIA
jgi:hypothetical protein